MTGWRALSGDPRSPDRHLFLVVVAALSLSFVPAAARAQFVGAATIESEYRLRGVALTNGEPDVRLGVTYDHVSGAYAGVSAIVGEAEHVGVRGLGYVANIGFARQTSTGLTWDVGATNSQITLYLPSRQVLRSPQVITPGDIRRYSANYTEVYAGISVRNVSARLYFSPDYLGQGLKTAYLDITAAVRPARRLRLYGHVGALTPLGESAWPNSSREHLDLAVGAAWEFRHGEVQAAWTTTTPQVEYPLGYRQTRSALVLSMTGFF